MTCGDGPMPRSVPASRSLSSMSGASASTMKHTQGALDALLARIDTSFEASAAFLDKAWAAFMRERLFENLALLRQP
jgi:hypothetical protein